MLTLEVIFLHSQMGQEVIWGNIFSCNFFTILHFIILPPNSNFHITLCHYFFPTVIIPPLHLDWPHAPKKVDPSNYTGPMPPKWLFSNRSPLLFTLAPCPQTGSESKWLIDLTAPPQVKRSIMPNTNPDWKMFQSTCKRSDHIVLNAVYTFFHPFVGIFFVFLPLNGFMS